ncbi:Hypothetical protein A7982_10479 [Minicystis rosea]|nr:Hypothetical protein A7982_10479 [Minicystis rosea]
MKKPRSTSGARPSNAEPGPKPRRSDETASAPANAASLTGVHLFPVRHHSPRSSAVLADFLATVRPEAVLIEAPEDAEKLLPALVDPETRPPVAILGYRTDGMPSSSLWPFAAYSPEYVAAKWGVEHGAKVGFIDIPIARTLGNHRAPPAEDEPDRDIEEEEFVPEMPAEQEPFAPPFNIHEACAEARGFRSFEEFWEASFEAPKYDAKSFREALIGYAELVRAVDRSVVHRARDAYMAGKIRALLGAGVAPERIVVVVGAAHAAALAAGEIDDRLLAVLPDPVQTEATLIPFSFPRLAEQLGYGAGNRAPQYYQRAHEAGCSFTRATLEVLVEFTEHLRLRGFTASLADTIEAYRLAVTLAGLRGKAEPGLDEVREATIATLCRGDATHVDGFLWPSVIGRNVGKVAGKIAKNSLQEEFWREVRERRLPATDSVEQFTLKLHNPIEVGTSVFLHRLLVAGIPYASFKRTQALRGQKASAARPEEATPEEALKRTNEVWEAQWTPSTDVALVQQIVLGETVAEVAARVLRERLDAAKSAGEAAGVLIEAVVTASPVAVSAALDACERFAATDDDLPSLARACGVLSTLVSMGTSRKHVAHGEEAIPVLCRVLFDRAVLRAMDGCQCDDEAVQDVKPALSRLNEVALAQPIVDRNAWITAARALVESFAINPSAAGYTAGLLSLAQIVSDEDVARIVALRVSDTLDPVRAASFLGGFFEVNAYSLLKDRAIVAALDTFLTTIPTDRFRDALPVLRRAFGSLGANERRLLLENVIGVRKIGDKAKEAIAVIQEKDKETLKAMNADLAKAMDDLDDLL